MNTERPQLTIRDYLFAFRRRKFVILGVMLIAAAAAGALTATKHKQYSAQAALQAQSPSQTAGYAGIQQVNNELPSETSAQLQQTATRTAVIKQVKSKLHLTQSISTIRSRLTVSTDPQSDFVLIDATAPKAAGAQALANAAANAVVDVSNFQIRAQFSGIANQENTSAHHLLAPYLNAKVTQLTPRQQTLYQAAAQQAQADEQLAAHLAAFAKVVNVAQVETPASLPSTPTGTGIAGAAVIGAIAGLVLGLLLAWFLESFDRRLRRPDETEEILGVPVIGAVAAGGLGHIPGEDSKDAAGTAAYRMLRTNVRFLSGVGAAPRTIVVTSALAQEGKTTVAIGLAMSSAASGLNTLLIEGDVHRPVLADRLGLKTGPGLADFLRGETSPEEILQVHSFVDPAVKRVLNGDSQSHTSKLTCITAGHVRGFSGDALASRRFVDALEEVKQVYDFVVVDTAPLLAVAETLEVLSHVDAAAFCVRVGKTTVDHVRAARAALKRVPERPMGLVLTDLPATVSNYYGYGYVYDYAPTNNDEGEAKSSVATEPNAEHSESTTA